MSDLKGDYQIGDLRVRAEPGGAQWRIAVSLPKETIYFLDQGREDIAKGRAAILASMIQRSAHEEDSHRG